MTKEKTTKIPNDIPGADKIPNDIPGADKGDEWKKEEKKPRQILIETDGNNIELVKAEVGGSIELIAILNSIIQTLIKK